MNSILIVGIVATILVFLLVVSIHVAFATDKKVLQQLKLLTLLQQDNAGVMANYSKHQYTESYITNALLQNILVELHNVQAQQLNRAAEFSYGFNGAVNDSSVGYNGVDKCTFLQSNTDYKNCTDGYILGYHLSCNVRCVGLPELNVTR